MNYDSFSKGLLEVTTDSLFYGVIPLQNVGRMIGPFVRNSDTVRGICRLEPFFGVEQDAKKG